MANPVLATPKLRFQTACDVKGSLKTNIRAYAAVSQQNAAAMPNADRLKGSLKAQLRRNQNGKMRFRLPFPIRSRAQ